MAHQITVSDETYSRLRELAEPFVDQPDDVIQRLLSTCAPQAGNGSKVRSALPSREPERSPDSRAPRERGVTVEIGDHRIHAVSVSDLYEQALKFLVEKHESRLTEIIPFRTSGQRFLVAGKPVHPSGKPFYVPVRVDRFHMEAHKDYKNAVNHLERLVSKLGLSLRYLG